MNTGSPIQTLLPWVIFLLMLGIGMSLRTGDFVQILHARKAAAVAFTAQFLLLPLSAFLLAAAFSPPPELQIGMVLLAASPSASTSTFFTYLARGDTALSIALTAFNKMFAVFTLPIYVGLASRVFAGEGQAFSLPAGDVFLQLATVILLPTVLGIMLGHRHPALARRLQPHVKRAAVLLLVILVVWVVWRQHASLPAMFGQIGPAMLLLCLLNMSISYLASASARLDGSRRTAIVLETGMQSGGTAILIATGILGSTAMSVPAVVYSLMMYPLAGLFVWRQKYIIR